MHLRAHVKIETGRLKIGKTFQSYSEERSKYVKNEK